VEETPVSLHLLAVNGGRREHTLIVCTSNDSPDGQRQSLEIYITYIN